MIKRIKYLIIISYLSIININGQELFTKEIETLNLSNQPISSIHIINLNREIAKSTNQHGKTAFEYHINDSISITSVHFKDTILIMNQTSHSKEKLSVQLVPDIILLENITLSPTFSMYKSRDTIAEPIKMGLPFKIKGFTDEDRKQDRVVVSPMGLAVRIGMKTKNRRAKEALEQTKKQGDFYDSVVLFGDSIFYCKQIGIKYNEIESFIHYILEHTKLNESQFSKMKRIEVIDLMLRNKSGFLEYIKRRK